ncbi:MAG: hypothetical protein PHR35_00445 [Kiritimatiellae bacterium]|nr:hypothetical protein [Kiritimatiellia bacterium]
MAVNYMRFVVRCVLVFAVIVAVAASVLIFPPVIRRWRILIQKRDQVVKSTLAKQEELAGIKRRQLRFQEDPEFVERVARQNRRVRPGEIIFIFDTPPEEE